MGAMERNLRLQRRQKGHPSRGNKDQFYKKNIFVKNTSQEPKLSFPLIQRFYQKLHLQEAKDSL